jgi:HSP20 family molecular chaperone IbpA
MTQNIIRGHTGMSFYPRTDISQDNDGMLIELALPGLSNNDVKLEFSGTKLKISGRHKERDQYAKYTSKELFTGFFIRTYIINTKIFDVTNISSKIINGLLSINIPYKNKNVINKVESITIKEENTHGNK